MASAKHSKEMKAPREKVWKAISSYEQYPSFVDNVHKVKILSKNGATTRVEYSIELMGKEIQYVLDHDESALPNKMTWKIVESNFLKSNFGAWEISETASGCNVHYMIDLEFKIPVPGFMLSGLIKTTLPKMLDSFEKQAMKE